MTAIRTVKELKEVIKDLPDDMEVEGYDGGDRPRPVSLYTHTPSKVEIEDGCLDVTKLIVDTD